MNPILAIDPGIGGGLAIIDADGVVGAIAMPDGMTAQIDAMRSLVLAHPGLSAVMERVGGYMPGNSGPSAATFARHCGHIEAAMYCMGVPTTQVAPAKWMKALGSWPKEKPDRKRAIRDAMARQYPHLSVTLKTADALGILAWATSGREAVRLVVEAVVKESLTTGANAAGQTPATQREG